MHFFGKNPLEFPNKVNLLCVENYKKSYLINEHYHMLKNSYLHLKPETREKILDIISQGPNPNDYDGPIAKFEEYKKKWRLRKLETHYKISA